MYIAVNIADGIRNVKTGDERIIFFIENNYTCLINIHRSNNKRIIILHF